MKFHTINEIRAKLQDRNQAEVARKLGLSSTTMYKIFHGQDNVTLGTYVKLVEYLWPEEKQTV